VCVCSRVVIATRESVHSCPVHSAKVGAGHVGHAGHHSAAQSHHESHDKSGAVCSCPGDCTGSAFQALPSAPARVADATILVSASVNPITDSTPLTRSDVLLPFAIGPPAPITAEQAKDNITRSSRVKHAREHQQIRGSNEARCSVVICAERRQCCCSGASP